MEEQFLIIRMAILDVHLFFLYLVALPEKLILYPLNLQMTKKKKHIGDNLRAQYIRGGFFNKQYGEERGGKGGEEEERED